MLSARFQRSAGLAGKGGRQLLFGQGETEVSGSAQAGTSGTNCIFSRVI
jgi:hypothetical protein